MKTILLPDQPDAPGARLLRLCELHCPRLMREGGGSLIMSVTVTPRLTTEERGRILTLARTRQLTATEIARLVGSTQARVFKLLRREGIKLRDGRKARP